MPRQNLHPDRQAGSGGSAWDAHARNARQTTGDGIDVREVHSDWVIDLLSQFKSWKRRNRRHDGIHLLQCVRKITCDQRAHLLRLHVVCIVIAMTEHVGAQHDAPLALSAKALATGIPIQIRECLGTRRAGGVAHAIEARQIGTGLRGRNNVVTRDGVIGRGQADFAYFATHGAGSLPRRERSDRRSHSSNPLDTREACRASGLSRSHRAVRGSRAPERRPMSSLRDRGPRSLPERQRHPSRFEPTVRCGRGANWRCAVSP